MMAEHTTAAPKINLDDARSTASASPEISRRRFLLNTTMAGAAVAVAAPAVAAEPEMTPRERAMWLMEELERLVLADGASEATIILCGQRYGGSASYDNGKSMALHPGKKWGNIGGMFAEEGGDA